LFKIGKYEEGFKCRTPVHRWFNLISGHDTGPGDSGKKYRPLFLDHFDKKEAANKPVIYQIP
jgi:hypothetical protein